MKKNKFLAVFFAVMLVVALVIGISVYTNTNSKAEAPDPAATRIDGSHLIEPGSYTFDLNGGGQITLNIAIGTEINKNGNVYHYNYVSSWSSTVPICSIGMKGGSVGINWYDPNGSTSGGTMKCMENNGGNIANISHVDVYPCPPTPTPTDPNDTPTPPVDTPTPTPTDPNDTPTPPVDTPTPTPTDPTTPTPTLPPSNTPTPTPTGTPHSGRG